MSYKVVLSEMARKSLKKLDKSTAVVILAWIRKNLDDCSNPRQHGKALTAKFSGRWRYRIGDYRLIANINDEKITILILAVGHRSKVYLK